MRSDTKKLPLELSAISRSGFKGVYKTGIGCRRNEYRGTYYAKIYGSFFGPFDTPLEAAECRANVKFSVEHSEDVRKIISVMQARTNRAKS